MDTRKHQTVTAASYHIARSLSVINHFYFSSGDFCRSLKKCGESKKVVTDKHCMVIFQTVIKKLKELLLK